MTCKKCGKPIEGGGFALDTNIAFITRENGRFLFCNYTCASTWYEQESNHPTEVQARKRQYRIMAGEFVQVKTA